MITKHDIGQFTFSKYVKVGTTEISNQTVLAGTQVETLEGAYTCAEPSRIALDVAGNVYPIAESVFQRCYQKE